MDSPIISPTGTPVWELATLYPFQGQWTREDSLALDGSRLIQWNDGCLEFLPMPTELHQAVVEFIWEQLKIWSGLRELGRAFFAPLRLRVDETKIREPGILFLLREDFHHRGERVLHLSAGQDAYRSVCVAGGPDTVAAVSLPGFKIRIAGLFGSDGG